jgi:hypothetical protein
MIAHAATVLMHIVIPEIPTTPPQTVVPISLTHNTHIPLPLEPSNNPLPALPTLPSSSLGELDPLVDDGTTGIPNGMPKPDVNMDIA